MAFNSSTKKTVKAVLGQYGVFPSKGLGQNFLIDKFAVKKVLRTANLSKKDIVLEIGPGLGALTQGLSRMAGQVMAVEKDPKMIEILKDVLKGIKNVEIIQADILKILNKKHGIRHTYNNEVGHNFKVVANLPFYLAAPVIRQFLESNPPAGGPPREMILVVQKEVGQRICAKPPKMNLLAVSVQFYAKTEVISYISKRSFWPKPKVDSAIIKITPKKLTTKPGNVEAFFKVVKAGFSQPRKQLVNNLAKKLNIGKEKIAEILQKNNISPAQRPETLEISDWKNLAKEFSAFQLL